MRDYELSSKYAGAMQSARECITVNKVEVRDAVKSVLYLCDVAKMTGASSPQGVEMIPGETGGAGHHPCWQAGDQALRGTSGVTLKHTSASWVMGRGTETDTHAGVSAVKIQKSC